MSKPIKNFAVILLVLFIAVVLYNMTNKTKSNDQKVSQPEKAEAIYREYADKQMDMAKDYQKEYKENLDRIERLNDKAEENQARFEKILETWESQADRIDTIIDKYEKE